MISAPSEGDRDCDALCRCCATIACRFLRLRAALRRTSRLSPASYAYNLLKTTYERLTTNVKLDPDLNLDFPD